jgi:hypothetical protein
MEGFAFARALLSLLKTNQSGLHQKVCFTALCINDSGQWQILR